MEQLIMTTYTPDQFKELVREVYREESGRKEESGLISYLEISELYNVGETTISRKVNAVKLEINKTHYKGRLRNAITKTEAEKLFRRKQS